ncbi:hypothetical protein [Hymenobacter sp. YC55]|uniref:hypothetical protein n=1 Tax=Hymenobacter sp. YC55 TaxID=3034019 RepID=UPI0023F71B7B|nr:hypothetical protein [Hymenobacter sp. YC55]MDF7810767.1 hypothetical protein [Hymenobacter sp. YC55]
MRNIILRDVKKKAVATGQLPEGWHEVTLGTFLKYQERPDQIRPTPLVLSMLTGISENILADDVSLCVPIWKELTWFEKTLPDGEPVTSFTLASIEYEHVGNLQKINAGQFEALTDFIRDHKSDPVQASPYLLAVFFKPKGKEQTPWVVENTAEAFRELPMSIAYPVVKDFLRTGASSALSIQTYLAVQPKAEHLLQTLEATLQSPGASKSYSKRLLRYLSRMWIRSVRGQL